MPETDRGIAALTRDVANLREELKGMRVEFIRMFQDQANDLHRHQDEDRDDFRLVRSEVGEVKSTVEGWKGGLNLLKLITIPCTMIAAAAGIINLIRHW